MISNHDTNASIHQPDSYMNRIPVHVALIMDGNGRWAIKKGLDRSQGHAHGASKLREIVTKFGEYGVKYVTLYAFSTENWARPQNEVENILEILLTSINSELETLHQQGVKIIHLGDKATLPEEISHAITKSEQLTENNSKITLSVAFSYGGRSEIIQAIKNMVSEGIEAENVDEKTFERHLTTYGIPDPDIIVRTAGEMRLSNFLIWQSAYSEYYFTDVLWPDFGDEDVELVIKTFSSRNRRYGKS